MFIHLFYPAKLWCVDDFKSIKFKIFVNLTFHPIYGHLIKKHIKTTALDFVTLYDLKDYSKTRRLSQIPTRIFESTPLLLSKI
jgi:hypothetical protein